MRSQYMHDIVEHAPVAIIVCEENGRIIQANELSRHYFGYEVDELAGQAVEILIPQGAHLNHIKQRTAYAQSPTVRLMGHGRELVGLRKDGSEFPIEISLQPVETMEGLVITAVIVDLTERRRVANYNDILNRLDSVKRVAATYSNEFNNIFASILGNTKLAWADFAEGRSLPATLTEVEKSVRRGSALARRLTALGWEREGHFCEVQLREVVHNSLPLIRAMLPSNIALEEKSGLNGPAVWGDEVQIEQMILNLASNAIDSMKNHGGLLDLEVEAMLVPDESLNGLAAGEYAQLTIRDTGSGMDAAIVKQIFDPFFSSKAEVGSGLGLYVVRDIANRHNARITVESAVGKGTIVRVCMAALVSQAPKVNLEHVGTAPNPGCQPRRILYVDDDESMVFLVNRILNRLGYEVTVSSDPGKALEIFRSEPAAFDAVVSDLSMPGFSGIHLARELLRVRPDLPILITTGCILPEDAQAVRNLGLPNLILKPDAVEDLGELIDKLFTHARKP